MQKVRQPIVTVLGHVDHGKTTLLDAVRQTNVAKREAGGITQGIGASVVTTKEGKKITFIDTPGHAAFSAMRARGAKVADIAILVVAADDGVKPQTKEAIKHILEAQIPFVVAMTKIDLPGANVDVAKASLEKEGVFLEGRGGQISVVEVSGKTGQGIQTLLEMITLLSEVTEIMADEAGDLEAVVIETGKDNRGPLASVVVRNGTLKVGDEIRAGQEVARVRGIFDFQNKQTKQITPGEPGLVLGFAQVPEVGAVVTKGEKGQVNTKKEFAAAVRRGEPKEGEVPVIIKTQNAGALEAVVASLPAGTFLVAAGVGEVTENDVFLAKTTGPALIFAFEAKVPTSVTKLAETEKVEIFSYKIIYELIQKIEEIIKKGLKVIHGRAEIIDSFPFNNKKVAGARMIMGRIIKGEKLLLLSGEKEIGIVRATSLRKGKDELGQVTEGEFGIIFEPQLDFTRGDVLISQS